MSKVLHGIVHAVLVGGQIAFLYAQGHPEIIGLIPQPAGIIVSGAIAGLQGFLAVYNHAKGK